MKTLTAISLGALAALGGVFTWANWPHTPLPDGVLADAVVVHKADRKMLLLQGGRVLSEYTISLGSTPQGRKAYEGDGRTPEGRYLLDWHNPDSAAHLAVHISYPNLEDQSRADVAGKNAGGLIMVHGIRNGFGWLGRLHRLADWTDGCIAITNDEMREFWRVVPLGTPIDIRP